MGTANAADGATATLAAALTAAATTANSSFTAALAKPTTLSAIPKASARGAARLAYALSASVSYAQPTPALAAFAAPLAASVPAPVLAAAARHTAVHYSSQHARGAAHKRCTSHAAIHDVAPRI